MRVRPSAVIVALAASATVITAVWLIDRAEQNRFQQQNRSQVLRRVSSARAQLEGLLNRRLFLARGLLAHVATRRGIDAAEFEVLAQVLLAQQTGIRTLQLAKDSVVSHVFPLKGNEAALGHNLLLNPARRAAVLRSIETRRLVVGGPFELLRGGVALVGNIPIFLSSPDSSSDRGDYWGLAMIVIDWDTLLSEAGLINHPGRLRFSLRHKEGVGPPGNVFWGDAAVFQSEPVVADVSFPNGAWELGAVPVGGWPSRSTDSWKMLAGGGLLSIVVGFLVWLMARQPERLRMAIEEATAALRKSEERYRTLAKVSPVGMFHTDASGQYLYVNQRWCEISGLPSQKSAGYGWAGALHPDDRARVVGEWQRAIGEKSPLTLEFRFLHPGGRTVWVLGQSAPEYGEGEDVLGYVGTITDITERKLSEERAEQRRAELAHVFRLSTMGEMASGLAHELNQPLSAIVNYARGAAIRIRQSPVSERDDLIGAMDQISTLAVRAGEIIRSVRNFVRKREPNRESVRLNDIVREAAMFLEGEARQQSIRMEFQLAEPLPLVEADRIQIEQVILNLLRNAFEAMTDLSGGPKEIRIQTASLDPAEIQVCIRDTGKGLSDEEVDRMFDPFFTTKPNGIGMGLSISRSIVEAHGGRLWATPHADAGTTFHFTLPTIDRDNLHDS